MSFAATLSCVQIKIIHEFEKDRKQIFNKRNSVYHAFSFENTIISGICPLAIIWDVAKKCIDDATMCIGGHSCQIFVSSQLGHRYYIYLYWSF